MATRTRKDNNRDIMLAFIDIFFTPEFKSKFELKEFKPLDFRKWVLD